MKYFLIVLTIIVVCISFFFTEIPGLIINELFIFTGHSSVYLNVDNALMLNIIIMVIFFLLLYFPSKINKEKDFLDRSFTDSLRGIAMFLIMMHHISRCIINPTDMIIYFDLGYVGAGCYLFLSGYGLMESYKKNGLSGEFFKNRFLRIFIPVMLINTFIQFLNYFVIHQHVGLIKGIASILGIINLNWFVGYIVFWYFIYYICFKRSIPDYVKIIILFAVSSVILASESVNEISRINALSFPCGVFISQYRSKIHDFYTNNKQKYFKIVCFLFGLVSLALLMFFIGLVIKNTPLDRYNACPSSIFIMQKPLSIFGFRLLLIGVCVLVFFTVLIIKRNEISIKLLVNLILFSFFMVISTPYFPREFLRYFIVNSSAILAIIFITILMKILLKKRSSTFFTLWGKMSLEILIMHGFFLNFYDFILFKLPLQYSIILFIVFITIISYIFYKISEFIQRKLKA